MLADPKRIPGGRFEQALGGAGVRQLSRGALQTLQINVGKVCNQTCSHCHVDAGPTRKEAMSRETAERVIQFLAASTAQTLDITGGAPEMNENFTWLVEQAELLGRQVIDRCNLTILTVPRYEYLAPFLAGHQVSIVASLPCYLQQNCDSQRGDGVFKKSIAAIRRLNELGYADSDTGLQLDLVYNPVGLGLPPDQGELEQQYRTELQSRYGIRFNRLFTITNMPVSRYLEELLRLEKYELYMEKLIAAFNPQTIDDLMCRTLLSVDWNGYVYDCDFNQMLGLPLAAQPRRHLSELLDAELTGLPIATGNHCFGCTAGCGSSCGGSLVAQS